MGNGSKRIGMLIIEELIDYHFFQSVAWRKEG